MRLAALLLAFFGLFTTMAAAAPFVVCSLDFNSRVIVDIGDNSMKWDKEDWVYAQILSNDEGFKAQYVNDGEVVAVYWDAKLDQSFYKIQVPDREAIYGNAFCTFQDK